MTALLIVLAWVAASILLGIAWVLLKLAAHQARDADKAIQRAKADYRAHCHRHHPHP